MTTRGLREPDAKTTAAGTTPPQDAERIPSIPVVHQVDAGHVEVRVNDDAFAPFILSGDTAVVDTQQTSLERGGIFAVRREGVVQLWTASPAGMYFVGDDNEW